MSSMPLFLGLLLAAAGPAPVHHEATLSFDPAAGRLDVTDRVTLPAPPAGPITVRLHGGLSPQSPDAQLEAVEGGASEVVQGDDAGAALPTDRIRVRLAPGERSFTLRYAGVIAHPPAAVPEEYQRSFQQTPGIISQDGLYLSGGSRWLPEVSDDLVTFRLAVTLPAGWEMAAPGRREGPAGPGGTVVFTSENAFDGVTLAAGPLVRHTRAFGDVEALVFLRTDDPALAARYLEATGQYLGLYQELLGPYPYRSFALVENFWETGYGMPGFTLLGEKIIRFPFILHSSYPHELLHNWFGNGVFVPPGGENWAEGLTAYLADHLVEEQRGRGAAYRRRTLTKYRDFVSGGEDFPLREFRGRSSPQTEAVGYGKWLMVLHMLRNDLGDEAFRQVLRDFYAQNRFRRATFGDFQKAAELVAGRSLEPFFAAFVGRAGAPEIRWSEAQAYRTPEGQWSVTVALRQAQAEAPFPLRVPVAVTLDDGSVAWGAVAFTTGRRARATWAVPRRPVRVDVDPRFETFRLLSSDETPPSFSGALGSERHLFVLPSFASDDEQRAFRSLAETLCGPHRDRCDIQIDKDVEELPADRAVWVLGYGNQLRAAAFVGAKHFGAHFDDGMLAVGPMRQRNGDHAVALALRSPRNEAQTLVFIGTHDTGAVPGLARKLPHYGRYGYLGFEGSEPSNVLKGEWPPVDSPLSVELLPGAGPTGRIEPRAPLATLPPPFDGARLAAVVQDLAAPARKGRGYGTPELDQALAVVERELRQAGLQPAGDSGYRQCFDDPAGPRGAVKACNLIGRLPGADPTLPAVVLGAHLDHLGTGWPEAATSPSHKGQVHPGANDNASGVAVLLEVARSLAAAGGGRRTLEVVVFTGEEAGLRGSRHFVRALGAALQSKVAAAVVLDTVGVRTGPAFLVLGHESAREWPHVFMGVGYVTGVDVSMGSPGLSSSDDKAFTEAGIPAVQLFAGPADGYHSPADTADKVRPDDLVAAAVVTREALAYLLERPQPLSAAAAATAPSSTGARQVSTGAVPDFRWRGPGVRLQAVLPGSALDRAGAKAGDILAAVEGAELRDLRHYSDVLKKLSPGQKLKLTLQRGEERIDVEIEVGSR